MDVLVTYPNGRQEVWDILVTLQVMTAGWLVFAALLVWKHWMERRGVRPNCPHRKKGESV